MAVKKKPATVRKGKPTVYKIPSKAEALAFLETQDLTIDEISTLSIKTLGPLFTNERLTKQDEFAVFNKMAEIEGINEYFRDTMSRDLKRFFAAADQRQQDQIRGAHLRVLYFMSLLNRKDVDDKPSKIPPIGADRYAGGAD